MTRSITGGFALLATVAALVPLTGAADAKSKHHAHPRAAEQWTLILPDGTTRDFGSDGRGCLDAATAAGGLPAHPTRADYEHGPHCRVS